MVGLLLLAFVVLAVCLISAIFSMFGQGGGSLYTPTLVLLGFATLVSVSTSLVLNLVTAAFAALVFFRQHLVDLRLGAAFVPPIVVGSFLGGAWGNFVNSSLLLWIFAAFLLGAGARMVYTYWESAASERPAPAVLTPTMLTVIVVFSFGVGLLSGLLGVGGGVLIVPFLIFVDKVPTKTSAGTSAFIVIFSSLFGVLGHSAYGHLDLDLIFVTTVAVAVGAVIGARSMVRTSPRWVKAGFGLILWAFAVQLIAKLVGG